MQPITRRGFLLSTAAVAACAGVPVPRPGRTLDIHVHLFGTGDAGSGCFLSSAITRSLNFVMLMRVLDIPRRGLGLDRGYAAALAEHLAGTRLDACAVLAQDRVYDAAGRPDDARTHVYVPNDHVLAFVAAHPKTVACVSINPDRRDALDELERCVASGARLLKIHPPTQGVDIAQPRHRRFFQRCVDLDVLVLVHTGHEHAAPVIDIDLADPFRMRPALDLGCRMVACHAGSGWPTDTPDYFTRFVELVHRHPNLYGDTAVMGTATRVRDLCRAADAGLLQSRLVHGSDFPFPSWPVAFADRLGRDTATELQEIANLLDRDYALKCAVGVGEAAAMLGHRLVFGPG